MAGPARAARPEYTVRAARAGVHGLGEKPMAVTERDSRNPRLRPGEGGPLYQVGIYCLNAARSLFGAEPVEAVGEPVKGRGARFRQVPETTAAVLRFPGERVAPLAPLRRARIEHEIHRPAGKKPRLDGADDPRPEED